MKKIKIQHKLERNLKSKYYANKMYRSYLFANIYTFSNKTVHDKFLKRVSEEMTDIAYILKTVIDFSNSLLLEFFLSLTDNNNNPTGKDMLFISAKRFYDSAFDHYVRAFDTTSNSSSYAPEDRLIRCIESLRSYLKVILKYENVGSRQRLLNAKLTELELLEKQLKNIPKKLYMDEEGQETQQSGTN